MPTIKDIIDRNYVSELQRNNDRQGLLQYMKAVKEQTDDISERNQLNNHIAKLSNQLRKEEGLLNGKSPDVRNAYYTMEAIKHGRNPSNQLTPDGRNYWEEYTKSLNDFGNRTNSDGSVTPATSIMFTFPNNESYDAFLQKGGYDDNQLRNSGIETFTYNGGKTISVAKNNPRFMEILNTLGNTHVNPLSHGEITLEDIGRAMLFKAIGEVPNLVVKVTGVGSDGTLFPSSNYEVIRYSHSPLEQYNLIQSKLEELENEDDAIWNTTITTLPYVTAGESKMMTKLDRGIINEKDFKDWREEEHRRVFNLIGLDNLTQYDIYADSQDDPNFKAISPQDKHNLGRKLMTALHENRIESVSAAIAGTQTGVYIVISDKTDANGNPMKDDSYDIGQRIFIQGALAEALEDAFNARSEWRAYKESVEMQHYGYDYGLSNGDRIIKDTSSPTGWSFVYKDGIKEVIDIDGIRNKINRDIIMQDATDYLSLINKNENRPSSRDYTVARPLTTTDERAFQVAVQTVQETMPGMTKENPDYWDEVYIVYDQLLNSIGYSGSRMFNQRADNNGR